MKSTQLAAHAHRGLPRGWVILSLALCSWALVAVLGSGLWSLFDYVASAV